MKSKDKKDKKHPSQWRLARFTQGRRIRVNMRGHTTLSGPVKHLSVEEYELLKKNEKSS